MAKRNDPTAPPLPWNQPAEIATLGGILVNNANLAAARETLSIADFFLHQHQQIYKAICTLADAGAAADVVTVCDELNRKRALDSELRAYVMQLPDGVPRGVNIAHYVGIIKRDARLRRIIDYASAAQRAALERGADPDVVLSRMAEIGAGLPPSNGHHDYGELGYSLRDFLAHDFPVYDHLIPGLIPARSNVLLFAKPHHLKSYFTLGIALSAAAAGVSLGMLDIPRPFRTCIVQVEEESGELQKRLRALMQCDQFKGVDPANLWVVDRDSFQIPGKDGKGGVYGFTPEWISWFTTRAQVFKPDLIIYDVLRRFFVGHGDPNSPEDSMKFLEDLDLIRTRVGCSTMLVHHEKKGEGDLFTAASGSGNFAGWAGGAVMRLQHKKEDRKKGVASVELEVDVKLGRSIPECRLVAHFIPRGEDSVIERVHMEPLEAGEDMADIQAALGHEWTVLDLAGHLGLHRKNAWNRLKEWWAEGKVKKVREGKRGRAGALAVWSFADDEPEQPTPIRHLQ